MIKKKDLYLGSHVLHFFSSFFWSLSLSPFHKLLLLELEMKLPLSLGSDLAVPPSGYVTCLLMSAHSDAEPLNSAEGDGRGESKGVQTGGEKKQAKRNLGYNRR